MESLLRNRGVAAARRARADPLAPNINFNLHKCIIINSIAALADVRNVAESGILQHSENSSRVCSGLSFCPSVIALLFRP